MSRLNGHNLFLTETSLKRAAVQRNGKIFFRLPGTVLTAVLLITSSYSCTMVSKKMLPGMEYRQDPRVEIIEYEDQARLQADCVKQHKKTDWHYSGCSLVPHDPQGVCIIRAMKGDEKTILHELAHCHGHADTFWPWMADFDFYSSSEPGR